MHGLERRILLNQTLHPLHGRFKDTQTPASVPE